MRFKRTKDVALSPIKEIELAAARIPGTVSLAQGIPSFDTPEVIKNYVKEKLDSGETAKYSLTPGLPELRELVSEKLAAKGMLYDPDGEIIITAGSIEGISATLLTITEPGDEVIIPSPSYASYQQAIRMAGCVPVFVPLDEERNFDLDTAAIARRITPRTAAIFYCNPNNPTGTLYSRAQSLAMMELAEKHDLMIITDEVYQDFLFTDEELFSPAQVESFRDRVVRIFSLSKSFAMTGWRVGYLHSSREVVTEILKVHDALVTCAPVISQHAAVAALGFAAPEVEEFRQTYFRRRNLTMGLLDDLSHVFDYQKPKGAYFVFPRVKDTIPLAHDSRALAMDLLEKGKVALVPGVAFGPTGESHLRMSFGREEGDIEEAFSRMNTYFQQNKQARVYPFPTKGELGEPGVQTTPPPFRSRLRARTRGLAVRYLHFLARVFLARRRPMVVAVAGNRGKTVFKRTITGLLKKGFQARANPRSYNTEIGMPLAVLGLEINPRNWRHIMGTLWRATGKAFFSREKLDVLVLELGTRSPGDMATLLATVRPHWAVITPLAGEVAADPTENLILQEEIGVLTHTMPPENLIIKANDPLLSVALTENRESREDKEDTKKGPFGYNQGAQNHFQGLKQTWFLGPDLAGESASNALQASIILGESLGMAPETIETFLREQTGKPIQSKTPQAG